MTYSDINLYGQDEKAHNFKEFKGKYIILYFYPKDNTPGCSLEAMDFTLLKEEFEKENAVIIGVSRDTVKSHINFCEKKNLSILLLSDIEEKLSKAFDVIKLKKNYGKEYLGIERSTFILDTNADVIKSYRKVKSKNHAKTVLTDLIELKKQ